MFPFPRLLPGFRSIGTLCGCCCALLALAGQDSTVARLSKGHRARIVHGDGTYLDLNLFLQWWNVVTFEFAGVDADPRYDMFVRRGRLGVSGRLHHKVYYQTSFAYDGVGKDSLSQAAGIPNQEDNSTFFPRDAFFVYQHHRLLNITMGYFRPKAGKESFYSSAFCISQEKSWASFQPRIHIVGRGIGRETGVNAGGLGTTAWGGFLYDVGFFDTNHPLIVGENRRWSPLATARFVLFLGDPEYTDYPIGYVQSGYGQRHGLSVGANGTYQGATDVFRANSLLGVDAQLNLGGIDVLFEYDWMLRDLRELPPGAAWSVDRCLTMKAAWNEPLRNGTILQPSVMYSTVDTDPRFGEGFNPHTLAAAQAVLGTGINWLIDRDRIKLGLHYYAGRRWAFSSDPAYSYVNTSFQFIM